MMRWNAFVLHNLLFFVRVCFCFSNGRASKRGVCETRSAPLNEFARCTPVSACADGDYACSLSELVF